MAGELPDLLVHSFEPQLATNDAAPHPWNWAQDVITVSSHALTAAPFCPRVCALLLLLLLLLLLVAYIMYYILERNYV